MMISGAIKLAERERIKSLYKEDLLGRLMSNYYSGLKLIIIIMSVHFTAVSSQVSQDCQCWDKITIDGTAVLGLQLHT